MADYRIAESVFLPGHEMYLRLVGEALADSRGAAIQPTPFTDIRIPLDKGEHIHAWGLPPTVDVTSQYLLEPSLK